MAGKSKSLSRIEQESQILALVTNEPLSLNEIADKTGINYYSVRLIITQLLQEKVVNLAGIVDRHKKYVYNVDSKRTEDRIPRLTDIVQKTSSKAIYILAAVAHENDMKIVKAARNLPRYVAKLMIAANVASHGQDVNFRLDRIREDMQREYMYAKSCASMYEQILQEPRFWDAKHLRTMTDDPDYNYAEVQKAADYYEQHTDEF